MATTAPHSTQNRFSRIGFSLGLRSQPELRGRARDAKRGYNEEDWYIPYTGPYELPPEPQTSRNRDRDSWGDPIFGLGNAGAPQGSRLRARIDDDSDDQHGFRSSGESRAQGRARSHSMVSNYTESTGVDNTRSSFGAARHSNGSSSQRPPALSYSSLDTAGGVGESPIPHLHGTGSTPHRTSLANLFGTLGIKSPSNSAFGERGIRSPHGRRLVRPGTASGLERSGKRLSTNDHRRAASGDSHNHSLRGRRGIAEPLPSLDSQATTDDDYYNSYYSTLLQTPARALSNPGDPPSISTAPPTTNASSSPSRHPYARALPKAEDLPPQPLTAPPTTHPQQRPLAVVPKLTFSNSQNAPVQPFPIAGGSTSVAQQPLPSNDGHQRKIKGSTSTPNLADRISTTSSSGTPRSFSKGKDWWFSAETWCDALLFPRPRLKLKGEGGSRGRIVSPPGSPVLWSPGLGTKDQNGSVASRVLVHSRSLVDLREGGEAQEPRHHQSEVGISLTPLRAEARSRAAGATAAGGGEGGERGAAAGSSRAPRPKSWAQDDLALISRIPSMTTVLADGERLADERKKWQSKAFNSLGNKHARSVSRARSKSLTANGRKSSNQTQSNISFLAARAHLGNQDVVPVLPSSSKHRKTPSRPETNSRQSHSRDTSHSQTQNSSLIQSLARSSKSHSRNHSRNESWSKTAFKAAKSTAAACCNNDATVTPVDEKKPQRHGGLEDALQRADTKVIRLADPALIPLDRNPSVSTRNGVSPTPSGGSSHINDSRIGIALSTPPTDDFFDRENIRLATHPYAQGGLYSYTGAAPVPEKAADYAGPHPSAATPHAVREAELPEGSAARHKLPPHVALHHPYAQVRGSTSPDSYEKLVKHPRTDSNIPPSAKMWVPLAPGVVREILPTDLRYSPFIDGDSKMGAGMAVGVNGITDTVGVGEALAYAAEHRDRESKDSGLGTSENIHGSKDSDGRDEDGYDITARLDSPSRVPVQYDVTKPTYLLQRAQRSVETAHTFASSPLEYPTPKIPDFVRNHPTFSPPLPRTSSDTSSQTSPRPLGSPTDLVGFQDLFYKPGSSSSPAIYGKEFSGDQSSNGSQTRLSGIPFDLKSPHRRPTSGLTSLARKLSEEYEQLSILEQTSSRFSASSGGGSVKQPPSLVRRPTEGSLEFVFEEVPHPDSPTQGTYLGGSGSGIVLPFQPKENIPEDVLSVSENERHEGDEDEDETEVFRLKRVETSTPAAVPNARRLSFTGQVVYAADRHEANAPHSVADTAKNTTETEMEVEARGEKEPMSPLSVSGTEARVLSGFQAPPTELTRSSYLTTSTMSRMSNLSDFPTPPKDYTINNRVSLLSSYFDEALGRSNGEAIPEIPSQMLMPTREESPAASSSLNLNSNNRLTFGAGADVEEIVQVLSD